LGIIGADVAIGGRTVGLVVEVVSTEGTWSEVGGARLVVWSDEVVVLESLHVVTNRIDTAPNMRSRERWRRSSLDIRPVNQGVAGTGMRGELVGQAF
jgi:hypothetical protein